MLLLLLHYTLNRLLIALSSPWSRDSGQGTVVKGQWSSSSHSGVEKPPSTYPSHVVKNMNQKWYTHTYSYVEADAILGYLYLDLHHMLSIAITYHELMRF